MRKLILGLLLSVFAGSALAVCPLQEDLPPRTVCLEWVPPTQNVDGTTLEDLSGFNVYYGQATDEYGEPLNISDPLLTETNFVEGEGMVIPNPHGAAGGDVPMYFVMTAYDSANNESVFSNEIMKIVTFPDLLPPGAPQLITVMINISN